MATLLTTSSHCVHVHRPTFYTHKFPSFNSKTRHVYHSQRQNLPLHRAVLDDTLISMVSKVTANTLCYPIESIRMWSISNSHVAYTLRNLFAGYKIYLPYTTCNNIVTFALFYGINEACIQHFNVSATTALFCTSVATSLLTSLYKIPVSYFLKRIVIQKNISASTLLDIAYFRKAYMSMLMEDIPEFFVKFYLRNLICMYAPDVHCILRAVFVGIVSTFVITPLEMYKTRVICHDIHIKMTPVSFALRVLCSMSNTSLFFLINDAISTLVKI